MKAPDSLLHPDNIRSMCEVARACPPGCFVEVGVYKGGSAWHLAAVAKEQGRELFLYDTFTGIPYQRAGLDAHVVGDFGDTSAEAVKAAVPEAYVVPGIFPASIMAMPPVAFAHVDADQYDSIKGCCEALGPLMVHGGAIVFDDYDCLPGATLALQETGWRIEKTATNKAIVRFFQ